MGKVNVGVVSTTKTMDFVPCIKCGGVDVKFDNCGYSSFDPYFATCKCGHEVKEMDTSISSIVRKWNNENDPEILLKKVSEKIEKLKLEAKSLKATMAKRKRKEVGNDK